MGCETNTNRRSLITAASLVLLALAAAFVWYSVIHNRPIVLVGPVDPEIGIVGVAAKGMTRKEVIGRLGTPLDARETTEEWEAKSYSIDPILSDYVPGIYADITWDNKDRLSYLYFDLDKYARRFVGELNLQLVIRGKSATLSRNLTLEKAGSSDFRRQLGLQPSQVRSDSEDVRIDVPGKDNAIILHFWGKGNSLCSVGVGDW